MKNISALQQSLVSPAAYEKAIARIIEGKELFYSIGKAEDEIHRGILLNNPREMAVKLARAVELGQHVVRPATPKKVLLGNKMRTFYAFALEDRIIHNVISQTMFEMLRPKLSPNVYSYLPGLSWWDAASDLAHYLRKHHRAHRKNPLKRGLYVIGHDFSNYTDSIPMGKAAPIWGMLRQIFQLDMAPMPPHLWELVELAFRPAVLTKSGAFFTNCFGVPMGSPICQQIGNMYAMPLDDALRNIPGAFYARFNDDFIFLHPDAEVARRARSIMDEILKPIGLELKLSKAQEIYLTAAGRPSAIWPEMKGKNTIDYLGYTMLSNGLIRLSKDKHRRFLRDIRTRARQTWTLLGQPLPKQGGAFLCSAIAHALDPDSDAPCPDAKAVRSVVNDLAHLKELDLDIARILAEEMTGGRGPRVFRTVSYAQMRDQWQLPSVFHERHFA